MENIIVPIGVLAVIFYGIVSIIRAITDYQLRRKLIQSGQVDPSVSNVLRPLHDNRTVALKWGLIILFGGLGLIIISLFDMENESPLPFGIEAVSISIGFLSYYFMSQRTTDASSTLDPPRSVRAATDYDNE